jgi:hypothetical protein
VKTISINITTLVLWMKYNAFFTFGAFARTYATGLAGAEYYNQVSFISLFVLTAIACSLVKRKKLVVLLSLVTLASELSISHGMAADGEILIYVSTFLIFLLAIFESSGTKQPKSGHD